MRTASALLVAVPLIVTSNAVADFVLLGILPVGNSFTSRQQFDSARPALHYLDSRNDPLFALFESLPLPIHFPITLDEPISQLTDSDFEWFAGKLTNGINEDLIISAWTPSGPVAGGGGLESEIFALVPQSGPDLVGYTIDHITEHLAIDILHAVSSGTGEDVIGTSWSVVGHYAIYGAPIPEPSTALLFGLGLVMTLSRTKLRSRCILVRMAMALAAVVVPGRLAWAQCAAGVSNHQVDGLAGNDTNTHILGNQCLAASGTNVSFTIEAMADLGCNAFDGTHNPPSGGQCPATCTPICCDANPNSKYVTVTANNNLLSPFISGSTNMPVNGQFFSYLEYRLLHELAELP